MLRLPFKYFLNKVDEMARPALKVQDEKGNSREYEPIANVPYFMGQNDINYLYQFPPSLWPEAFHYRINYAFREFIEHLMQNEQRALNGEESVEWNDNRDVWLKWKATQVSKEDKAEGAVGKLIKYKFPNVKMYVKEYYDAVQRDVDTEFFASHDDTPEARKEYEAILKKALEDNADTGGYFGTSLRKYTGLCNIKQTQKVQRKGEEETKEEDVSLWACIGYNPVTYATISSEISNWMSASHMGWGVSPVDPAHRKTTVPNKGKEHFKGSAIVHEDKLKAISRRIKQSGGENFRVAKDGSVRWSNAEKWAEIRDADGKVLRREQVQFTYGGEGGIPGIEKQGSLPHLQAGYKVDSDSVDTIENLSNLTNFSELQKELIDELISSDPATFEKRTKEILEGKGGAKQRFEGQINNIASIREILSVLNSEQSFKSKLDELYEAEIKAKSKKEQEDIKKKTVLLKMVWKFKTWSDQNYQKLSSQNASEYKTKYEQLLASYKEVQNSHYQYEAEASKDKKITPEEEAKIKENEETRKKFLEQLESAYSAYEYMKFTQTSNKIVPSNFIPLLAIYLRDVQLKAKRYDVFSYAIASHNAQRNDRNPLGLDMPNPLAYGDRKYPGLGDKSKGIGAFEPNKSSKHRLHANSEQWQEIKKYFATSEINEFPFGEKEINQLRDQGSKYFNKVLEYLNGNSELVEYLGVDNITNLKEFESAYQKAKKENPNAPKEIAIVQKELKDTSERLGLLDRVSETGSIQSAVQEGVEYAIKPKGGDQVSEASKYDPTFPASLEFAKDYIAKAAEIYLMRASGSGPLVYWLKIANDPKIDILKKLKVYFEARDEVKEIVKNYVYTLAQLPSQDKGSALEASRRKRKDWVSKQAKQTSQLGSSDDGETSDFDAQISGRLDSSGISAKDLLSGDMVNIISSSIFDNSDPSQKIAIELKRSSSRKFRPASGTMGVEIEGGTVIGHDIEFFSQFIADKVKEAQAVKEGRKDALKQMNMDQSADNEVLSQMGFASLLYKLMELEVEETYGDELSQEKDQKTRDGRKKYLVGKMMTDWKKKNLGEVPNETNKVESPDLSDGSVASLLQKSLNGIISDIEDFDRAEVNPSKIPTEIRSPEVINALETLAVVIQELPKDENGSFDMDDLDTQIDQLDQSPSSPWASDPNKEYKINVVMISTGGQMKYKQAARAISGTAQEPKLNQQQVQWIQNRIEELKKKKKPMGIPLKKPMAQPTASPTQPPVNPIPVPQQMTTPTTTTQMPTPQPEAPVQPKVSNSGGYLKRRTALHQPKEEDF